MEIKKLLLIGILVTVLLTIGFASAQLNINGQTNTSINNEQGNIEKCGGLGNCERLCNGDGEGKCEGLCQQTEQRNQFRRCGSCDGTGNGLKNCQKKL
jgi:hypothetical protein